MITEAKKDILNKKLDRFNALNKAGGYQIISDIEDLVESVSNDAMYISVKDYIDGAIEQAIDILEDTEKQTKKEHE